MSGGFTTSPGAGGTRTIVNMSQQLDSTVLSFLDDSDPPVRGFFHRPSVPPHDATGGDALVLTHGAGSNCQAPLLVAVANAFAAAGYAVLRCDLPYRQKRPHGPPFPGASAVDRDGLRNAVSALSRFEPDRPFKRVFLGGHSYGGRQATMLAASDPALIDALLLLSYQRVHVRRWGSNEMRIVRASILGLGSWLPIYTMMRI